MKKNDITELVFILDRSGSMAGLEDDTIGGFNAMIAKQKEQKGKCYVTTILFDNESSVVHDRVLLEEVRPMTRRDYSVGGCTALLDAVGGTIRHISRIHRYARREDVPAHTVFVITTDGMENASRKYGAARVKDMIRHEKEKYGWEFLFLAANIDAVSTAEGIGIGRDRSVKYRADGRGTRVLYDTVSHAVGCMRGGAALDDSWSEPISEDLREDR